MNMDLSTIDILQNIFNIQNVVDFKRSYKFSEEPDEKLLVGFEGDKMIFKNNIIDNSVNTAENGTLIKLQDTPNHSKTEENAKVTQLSTHQTYIGMDDSSKRNEISSKSVNTEKQEVNINKIVLGTNGKKFLFLNGQKLHIIKHATNSVPSGVNSDLTKRIPAILPKLVPNARIDSKSVNNQTKRPSRMYIESTRQNISMSNLQPLNVSHKFGGKILSIDKSICPSKLSNVMKEVGGTIRLVNNVSSNYSGIPLVQDISSRTPEQFSSVKVPTSTRLNTDKMESNCKCKNKQNLSTVSTNTDQVNAVDKGIQTEPVFQINQVTRETRVASPLRELYSSNVIIGDDVNMGHGPPALFAVNEQKMKLKFFHDLQSCLKWDAGSLPIHKAVIDQDLQAVKGQCVILKIRKVGLNIPDSNNYTPLQLAIINGINVEIVKILLEHGADMSVLDSEGNNILHLAVEHNRNDLVKIFLDQLEGTKLNIDHFNYEGVTPLMVCAFLNDRIDMAEQLLKNKADLNLKDRKSGRSAIFHAAVSHNAPMVLLLLDYGANTKIRNFFGTSVHDAMFELDDIPNEIKYPILGRDLKINEKRKLNQQDNRKQDANKQEKRPDTFKRKKLEIVTTYQKLESKAKFIVNAGNVKK